MTPIRFDDHFDTESLKIAVANLPYDDVGETRIDLGLELANEMFSVESGARGSSKKVCFALLLFLCHTRILEVPKLPMKFLKILLILLCVFAFNCFFILLYSFLCGMNSSRPCKAKGLV